MVFLELRRDSRVTTGISGFLLCWAREVQSSIRVARESWGLHLSQCRTKKTSFRLVQSCLALCDPMDCSPPGFSAQLNMPANLENSAVATGLENISFHSNPKESQSQRIFKLPHNYTHLAHCQSNAQNSPSQASIVCEL